MMFIAGQEPEDVHSNSVAPGNLAGQARQVSSPCVIGVRRASGHA